jgi:hypothetical protein
MGPALDHSEAGKLVRGGTAALPSAAYSVCRLKGTRANNNPGG